MANKRRRPARSAKGAAVRRSRESPSSRRRPQVVGAAPTRRQSTENADEDRVFRLGAVPGATPGKWIDVWKQRMPMVPIELVPISVANQAAALSGLDAALVRLPIESRGLHAIALYDEDPVVVAGLDSHLLVADELTISDLRSESVMTPSDNALPGFEVPGALAPRFGSLTTAEAIATAAAGTGIVVVPMSLARLHHRKDADYRPLADGPRSTVALVWPQERTTADVETFVGIVRGRTPNSSR